MRLVAGYTVGTLVHTNEGFRAYIPTVVYKGDAQCSFVLMKGFPFIFGC